MGRVKLNNASGLRKADFPASVTWDASQGIGWRVAEK
jgi:hypothetical protein